MLNALLAPRTDEWFARPDCSVRPLIDYIRKRGALRDAQIEAIKTYLFLKIEGDNRPLWELFANGALTNRKDDLNRLALRPSARTVFESDTAARALYDWARGKDVTGKPRAPLLERYLLDHAGETDCADCNALIKNLFYGVEYADYLFSLPMGAGKTYLMAAFMYLDLYFAQNEPTNPAWAHNFVFLAPSGLKSSILPSLKTIENFDPTWALPEPAASNIKKLIRFEVLDQPKTAVKSAKTRSPNAVKVSGHQPFDDLMGLVIVTNAEKVILDRVRVSAQGVLLEETDDEKDKYANELRNLIGKIPHLQILIDEVHHAATDEVKLRQVVNKWGETGNLNGVLGFSGTPYLAAAEEVKVADGVSLKLSQITNTVFYYPLTRAIKGFLKKPNLKRISAIHSDAIVRTGVDEFREKYGALRYQNGAIAKLAIYCGSIDRLENKIFPLLAEMGVAPGEILKYHRGNKDFLAPVGAKAEWKILDTALSQKRIVLLVQIGKEGWDCRSLTGVILSQKGDCPPNMVLQTSCRCLRYMDGVAPDGGPETAGIWLNADNAKILDKQLKEEQHTSIEEINKIGKTASANAAPLRPRFDRTGALRLPHVPFYQLRVQFDTLTTGEAFPAATLAALEPDAFKTRAEAITTGITGLVSSRYFLQEDKGEWADFDEWLYAAYKGGFGAVSLAELRAHTPELRRIFEAITYEDQPGVRRFNALYDETALASAIRLAFAAGRTLQTKSDIVPIDARLLLVDKLGPMGEDKRLYPSLADEARIREMDATGKTAADIAREMHEKQQEMTKTREAVLQMAAAQGLDTTGLFAEPEKEKIEDLSPPVQNKDRSFHYTPYLLDSPFEQAFLSDALTLDCLRERNLEAYFNGEGELTEFRIDCFARVGDGKSWGRVGLYTPDFLIVERGDNNAIHRALIVETKGSGFASDFAPRRRFVETEWLRLNNEKFGYARFDFLYLEGDMDADARFALQQKIKEFFT